MKITKRITPFTLALCLLINIAPSFAQDYAFNESNCAEAKKNLRNIQKEQFSLEGKTKNEKKPLANITLEHDKILAQIMLLRGLKEIRVDYKYAINSPAKPKEKQTKNHQFQAIKNDVEERLGSVKKIMAIEMIIKDDIKTHSRGINDQEKYISNLEDKCSATVLNKAYKRICGLLKIDQDRVSDKSKLDKQGKPPSSFRTIVKGFYKLYHSSLKGDSKVDRVKMSQDYINVLLDIDPTIDSNLDEIYKQEIKDQGTAKKGFEKILKQINSIEKNVSAANKDKNLTQDKITGLYDSVSNLQDTLFKKHNVFLSALDEKALDQISKTKTSPQNKRPKVSSSSNKGKKLIKKLNNYTIALAQRHPHTKKLEDFTKEAKLPGDTRRRLADKIKGYLKEVGCTNFSTVVKNFKEEVFSNCMNKIKDIDLDKKIEELNLERKKWAISADKIRKKSTYKALNTLKKYAAYEYRYHCEKPKESKELLSLAPFQTCDEKQTNIHPKEFRTFVDDFGNLIANIKSKVPDHKPKNYQTLMAYYSACQIKGNKLKKLPATKNLCGKIRQQLHLKQQKEVRKTANKKASELREKYDIYGSNGRTIMTKHKSNIPEIASMVVSGGAYTFQTYSGYRNLSYTLPGTVDYLMSIKSANAFKTQYYGGFDPFAFGLGNYNGINVYGLQAQNLLHAAGSPPNLSGVDIGDTDQYRTNGFDTGSVEISGGANDKGYDPNAVQITN